MSSPGDELLTLIRQYVVSFRVPASQVDLLTELVARSLVTMMSDPHFYNHLSVVQELQQENQMLRQNLAQLTALVGKFQPRKSPPRKKAAGKRSAQPHVKTTRKAPPVRGSSQPNRQAFREGYEGG